MLPPLSPAQFQRESGVSRETLARLETYVELLAAWNRRINLVGPRTLGDVWRRHILDSAQLFPLLPQGARVLVDLGSGAGLPGLILAILGVGEVHLIESDQRKCAFLREAARVTGTAVALHPRQIAEAPVIAADIITARAFAPLPELLDHAVRFNVTHSILLLHKGQAVAEELTRARRGWRMEAMLLPSVSDPSGTILRLAKVTHAR